ncbi:MAG: cell division protein ZapB [Myxococcota bacterium]
MTTRAAGRYDHTVGGDAISIQAGTTYGFDRLEQAVTKLVEQQRALRQENARLIRELGDRDHRIGVLEGQILELNQRRQDVGKRVDELISQIEHLDARFGVSGS